MGDNRGVGFIGTNLKQTKGSHLAVLGDIYWLKVILHCTREFDVNYCT